MERKWLCFSPSLSLAYCQVCWLFGGTTEWAQGVLLKKKDGLQKRIAVHETSFAHRQCHKNYLQFTDRSIDHALDKQILEEENQWVMIMERVMSVIMSAASMNIALRGHREIIGGNECSGGNFLELVNLVAKFDGILSQVISMEKGKTRYLSPTIQNEVIVLIATETTKVIVNSVLQSPFFALILDSTTDISKVSTRIHKFLYIRC